MGASVSVASDLPPTLTEEQVQAICGEAYNLHWFQALANEFGIVDTTDLITLVNSKEEREVLLLYFTYCPTGRMKNSAFYALCRECKLLSKADLSIQKAEKVFESNVSKHEALEVRTICYRTFRYHVLPDVAPIKSWTFEKLMKRLSECESQIEEKKELRKARLDVPVSSNVEEVVGKVTAADCLEGVGVQAAQGLGLGAVFGASQHNAVVKIQSISRQKSGQKEAKRLREVSRLTERERETDRQTDRQAEIGRHSHSLLGNKVEELLDFRCIIFFHLPALFYIH
jgi:hypothetical protein